MSYATWAALPSIRCFFAGPKQIRQIEPLFGYDIWSDSSSSKQTINFWNGKSELWITCASKCYARRWGQPPRKAVKCIIYGSHESWIWACLKRPWPWKHIKFWSIFHKYTSFCKKKSNNLNSQKPSWVLSKNERLRVQKKLISYPAELDKNVMCSKWTWNVKTKQTLITFPLFETHSHSLSCYVYRRWS